MHVTDQGLVLVRNSERSSFRRCRQRWQWGWVDGLKPHATKPPLRFGDLIHQALAAYYIPGRKRGPNPVDTFIDLYTEDLADSYTWGGRDEEEVWHDARELGIEMLTNYVERYGDDSDIEVIQPEMPFQVTLTSPGDRPQDDDDAFWDDEEQFHLPGLTPVGTFDAAIRRRSTKKIGLLEHKTAKSIQTRHLPLDEQAGTYWALAADWLRDIGVMKRSEDLDFILYNFLRKGMKDERPRNKEGLCLNKPTGKDMKEEAARRGVKLPPKAKVADIEAALRQAGIDPAQLGAVSKNQPSPLFHRETVWRDQDDRQTVIQRIKDVSWEMWEAQNGRLPIYKTPTRDCSWDCAFYDICELHETGSDWEELRDLTMGQWDPYEAHTDDRSIPEEM